jgi:hypothetical protein
MAVTGMRPACPILPMDKLIALPRNVAVPDIVFHLT